MKSQHILSVLIGTALLIGCSSTKTVRVAVPPRVDLRAYQVVGIVTFGSNANTDLERLSTQKFLQEVTSAQPGTRVIELGWEPQVLSSVGKRSWDASAIRAIKQRHGVDAIVIGQLDMQKARPQIHASSVLKNLSARADVNAALSAKLIETDTGATIWTNSAQVTANVAHGSIGAGGKGNFAARDPEAEYGNMIHGLAIQITEDFREHYVLRRVPKGQMAGAGY